MRTSVSAQEALVLIWARNDLFCYSRIGWRWGVCQGYVRCVSVARTHFPAPNQRRNATKLNTLTLSNFRGKTVGPICHVFSWTRMRLQLRILFRIKALPIRKKTRKTCWGGGGGIHPHQRAKHMTCTRL